MAVCLKSLTQRQPGFMAVCLKTWKHRKHSPSRHQEQSLTIMWSRSYIGNFSISFVYWTFLKLFDSDYYVLASCQITACHTSYQSTKHIHQPSEIKLKTCIWVNGAGIKKHGRCYPEVHTNKEPQKPGTTKPVEIRKQNNWFVGCLLFQYFPSLFKKHFRKLNIISENNT